VFDGDVRVPGRHVAVRVGVCRHEFEQCELWCVRDGLCRRSDVRERDLHVSLSRREKASTTTQFNGAKCTADTSRYDGRLTGRLRRRSGGSLGADRRRLRDRSRGVFFEAIMFGSTRNRALFGRERDVACRWLVPPGAVRTYGGVRSSRGAAMSCGVSAHRKALVPIEQWSGPRIPITPSFA
jgi:hypothetical protein